jgi:predicted nucleic acid-binding protein
MLADSDIFIYATQPDYSYLIDWIKVELPSVSPITHVETLGYHHLQTQHKTQLNGLFDCLACLYPSAMTFTLAIQLRQQRKMSLGDALIAATALEHHLTLATHNTDDFKWIEGLAVIDPVAIKL